MPRMDQQGRRMEELITLTIVGRIILTIKILSYILLVLLCMLSVIRPDYSGQRRTTCARIIRENVKKHLFIRLLDNQK
jgi:hypothetical protein